MKQLSLVQKNSINYEEHSTIGHSYKGFRCSVVEKILIIVANYNFTIKDEILKFYDIDS